MINHRRCLKRKALENMRTAPSLVKWVLNIKGYGNRVDLSVIYANIRSGLWAIR